MNPLPLVFKAFRCIRRLECSGPTWDVLGCAIHVRLSLAPWPVLLCLLASLMLPACSLMPDRTSIRAAPAAASAAAGEAVVRGRIRIVVDGQDHPHGLLDRPALQLFHRGQGRMMATPEADRQGRFVWRLPPGEYGVAVLRGGLTPTRSPMLLPSGALAWVHGLVDPGIEFDVAPGRVNELGTLVVEIESRRATDILGQPKVFGRLLALRVEAEPVAVQDAVANPFRLIQPQRTPPP